MYFSGGEDFRLCLEDISGRRRSALSAFLLEGLGSFLTRQEHSASHRCWHRYSCQLSHQPLSDTLLVGTRKRALMSLRVRLEGFASYSPFSIAMLLPLFLP
jgi:hypothetical protein